MKNTSKLLFLGVSFIVLAITITVVVFSLTAAKNELDQFNIYVEKLFGKAGEPKFAKYCGQYVDGKTVRSTMEDFGGDYFIRVKTRKNPVSFVVAHKPFDHTIMVNYDGDAGMVSYVSSSSLCYVNENALFSAKAVRDSSGTLLGITFTEKGAGAVTKAVQDAYAPSVADATITDAKTGYTNLLRNVVASSNLNSIVANTRSVNERTQQLEAETLAKNSNLYPPVTEGADNTSYTAALAARDAASADADNAWVSLMNQCKLVTGIEPTGHMDISRNDTAQGLDDSSNLQFWVNLYNNG